jgi:uncharacterized protein YjbI with pentapeptide repeats
MRLSELEKILSDHYLWRRTGGMEGTRLDLSGRDLYGAKFSGADLTLADFSGAYMTNANMRRVNLVGADLTGARLPLETNSRGD